MLSTGQEDSAVLKLGAIDFEWMQACEDTLNPDMPEMYTIFGETPAPNQAHRHGG